MIFFESFENRVSAWLSFRKELEKHPHPLERVIEFWNKAPISTRSCDPFDQTSWPKPWDLIEENHYCEFSKILAIYYTLVLTDRFQSSYFEIQVVNDSEAHELKYLLIVNNNVVGYYYNQPILQTELPTNLKVQASYPMLNDFL